MPLPAPLDHVFVAILVAVLPIHGAWEYRRLERRLRAGVADARAREYRDTMLAQWAVTAGLLALWSGLGRPAAELGFALPGGWRLAAGLGTTLLVLAFLAVQWRAVTALDAAARAALRTRMEPVADLLPRTHREAALFRGLSVTAGICEEIVYRGYLIWYLAAFVGEWPGAVLAALAFGVLHAYQGAQGAVKTGVVGLVAGALYLVSGSLLWPMVLHAAVDLQGGAVGRRVLGGEPVLGAAPPAVP